MQEQAREPLEDLVGDVLQKARQGKGWSLAELAHRSGIGARRLDALEHYAEPTVEELHRLGEVLGLSVPALLSLSSWLPEPARWESGSLRVLRLTSRRYGSHAYLLGPREGGGQALVVDPGDDAPGILAQLSRLAWTVAGVLVTHAHGDHVGALGELVRHTGARVWAHPETLAAAGVAEDGGVAVADRAELSVGPYRVEVWPTPGHASGHLAFRLAGWVWVGDALFAGSAGRPEHPDTYPALLRSVATLVGLAEDVHLLPGHGPPTTPREERAHNPFYRGPGDGPQAGA